MQQHIYGVVGSLILVLLEIYCSLQQWKNFANRSRIDKVIAIVRVAPFFWLTVYSVPAQETAKHRAKFRGPLLSDIGAVTKQRCETRWNLLGSPKLAKQSQPLVSWRSSYYEDMWSRYCCSQVFFPIINTCLSCQHIARQSCVMVHRWWIFASCIFSEPCTAHFRPAF